MKKIAVIALPRSGSNYFTSIVCECFNLLNLWEIFHSHADEYKHTTGDIEERLLQITTPADFQGVLFKAFTHQFQSESAKDSVKIIKDYGFKCIWLDRENIIDQFLSFRYAVLIDSWAITTAEEKEKSHLNAKRNILKPTKYQFNRFMRRKNAFYKLFDEVGKNDLFILYESFIPNENRTLKDIAYKFGFERENINPYASNLKSELDYELITENYQEVESWFKQEQSRNK